LLTLRVPEGPEDGLVAERVLAALHHKLQLVVDVVRGLLLQKPRSKRPRVSS
jgi:hypothetical protein